MNGWVGGWERSALLVPFAGGVVEVHQHVVKVFEAPKTDQSINVLHGAV